jgi:hypothetical protein
MWEKIKSYLLLATILIGCLLLGVYNNSKKDNVVLGAGQFEDTAKWVNFSSFSGYNTKLDPSKVPDSANPQGQNTTANDGDRISVRNNGFEIFPTTDTISNSTTPIISMHTFRQRDGRNIMMRSYSTYLEYFNTYTSQWEILKGGYTSAQTFGFADININTDLVPYVYFGNGVEAFSRWTGMHDQLNGGVSIGAATVVVDDAGDFDTSGSIVFCGTEHAYTSHNATTFTLTGTATVDCADNDGVAQAVQTYPANPVGNIYMAYDNRLLISGIATTTQAVYFSAYGDATSFAGAGLVTASTDTSPDIFNLAEGGGAVTGLAMDEQNLYIFKRSLIYAVTLTDTDYNIQPLKPFDGKGQTTGAVNQKSIFTGHNAVFFITPDNQIMSLQRVEQIDYPQIRPISDVIKPTVDAMDFSDSAGVVYKDKAYFSLKSTPGASQNDTVLVWNTKDQMWDSPIVGWNVNEWNVYGNGTTEDLYYGSSIGPNTYKITNEPNDGDYDVTANYRTKQFDFGMPYALKQLGDVYVDGYISPNTTLTISLLLDEDGFTQTFKTDIVGTNTALIYNSTAYNIFGLNPFGYERFGSNADLSGKKRFRVYLGKDFRTTPFYTAQLEFASDGQNQKWEILNYGFKVRENSMPELRSLYQAFK